MSRPFAIPALLLLPCLLLAACASREGSARPEAPPEAQPELHAGPPVYDPRTFFETTSISGGSFSHDGSRIVYTSDASGVPNVFNQPAEGGEAVQLTHSDSIPHMAVSCYPHDERVLVTADGGGDERHHLYVFGRDGELTDLTPGEGLKARFLGWSRSGWCFFAATNERDPRHFDVYQHGAAPEGRLRRMLFENTEGYQIGGVSDDGRFVALKRSHTNADDDLYVWDASRPEEAPARVTPHEPPASFGGVRFRPGTAEMYYLSTEGSEFNRLWALDLESGEHRLVEEAPWDFLLVRFSWDGRFRVSAVNEDAHTRVSMVDLGSGWEVALPDFGEADLRRVGFSRDGRRLALTAGGDTSPSDLYVMPAGGGEPTRITRSLNPAVDAAELVSSEVVRYPSFDGMEIPALLYRPRRASAARPVPAVVWVHGGPGGQARVGYRPDLQLLVNHGFAVLAVNNRGSSGYGSTFYHADDRRHGEADLADCVFGRRYLEGLDWIRADRVAIMGGSYGGYMVAAALAFQPQAFDCGVDLFGPTNWLRTLRAIPEWWASHRESLYAELGDPAVEAARLHAISPLFHAGNIERPLLVIQGATDPRVLQRESDELVEAARDAGVEVEYLVFPDEGHGFRKRENRIRAAEVYLRFLDRYLKSPRQ